jgi:hypothetical protein
MLRNANRIEKVPLIGQEEQLAAAIAHLEHVKDLAAGLGESRAIWTSSAAESLAAHIREQAEAALAALKQLQP